MSKPPVKPSEAPLTQDVPEQDGSEDPGAVEQPSPIRTNAVPVVSQAPTHHISKKGD